MSIVSEIVLVLVFGPGPPHATPSQDSMGSNMHRTRGSRGSFPVVTCAALVVVVVRLVSYASHHIVSLQSDLQGARLGSVVHSRWGCMYAISHPDVAVASLQECDHRGASQIDLGQQPPPTMDKFVLVDLPSIQRVVYHLVLCPSEVSFVVSQLSASVVRVLAQARTLPASPDPAPALTACDAIPRRRTRGRTPCKVSRDPRAAIPPRV